MYLLSSVNGNFSLQRVIFLSRYFAYYSFLGYFVGLLGSEKILTTSPKIIILIFYAGWKFSVSCLFHETSQP